MCRHKPTCPLASSSDHAAAHVVAALPEQGWSLLCNGVVLFEDYGELMPDGRVLSPPHADFAAVQPHSCRATLTAKELAPRRR